MPKFLIDETIHSEKVSTVRLGTGVNKLVDADAGLAVKLSGNSNYAKCADGDEIEGFVSSVGDIPYDGFVLGGIVATGLKKVEGTAAIGDLVVAAAGGKGVTGFQKVKVGTPANFKWRVVADHGNSKLVIERV